MGKKTIKITTPRSHPLSDKTNTENVVAAGATLTPPPHFRHPLVILVVSDVSIFCSLFIFAVISQSHPLLSEMKSILFFEIKNSKNIKFKVTRKNINKTYIIQAK